MLDNIFLISFLMFLASSLDSTGAQKTIPIEPQLEEVDFPEPYRLEVVAESLRAPWSIEFLADGRILFAEKIGRVRIIEKDRLLEEPALVLPVTLNGTSGMFSIVAHPDFERNGWVYVSSIIRYGGRPLARSEPLQLGG
jgi:glucose/arabinose dehydrogenase